MGFIIACEPALPQQVLGSFASDMISVMTSQSHVEHVAAEYGTVESGMNPAEMREMIRRTIESKPSATHWVVHPDDDYKRVSATLDSVFTWSFSAAVILSPAAAIGVGAGLGSVTNTGVVLAGFFVTLVVPIIFLMTGGFDSGLQRAGNSLCRRFGSAQHPALDAGEGSDLAKAYKLAADAVTAISTDTDVPDLMHQAAVGINDALTEIYHAVAVTEGDIDEDSVQWKRLTAQTEQVAEDAMLLIELNNQRKAVHLEYSTHAVHGQVSAVRSKTSEAVEAIVCETENVRAALNA